MKKSKSQLGNAHLVTVVILMIIIIGLLGFTIWQNFIQQKSTTSQDIKQAEVQSTKSISFNSSLNVPVSFEYPDTWTVSRDTTYLEGQGNSSGSYERIRIYNPSKDIYVELFADNNFIGLNGGCTSDSELSLPDNAVKLENYPNVYYAEQTTQSGSGGLYFEASIGQNVQTCLSSFGPIVYKDGKPSTISDSNTYFTANIIAKSITRNYFDSVKVEPDFTITQAMIDEVTSSSDFNTAKSILLSAKLTES